MKKTGFASPNFPKKRALEIQREGGLSHSRKHMASIGRKGGWRTQELARAQETWTIHASKPV